MGEESDTAETKDNYANGSEEVDEAWQQEYDEEDEALEAERITEMRKNAPWRSSFNHNISSEALFAEPTWIPRFRLNSGKDVSGFKIWVGNLPSNTDRIDISNFLVQAKEGNDEYSEAYKFVTDVNVHSGNSQSGDVVAFYGIMENQLAAGQGNNFL